MEKIFYANGNQKKAGVTILISDKVDFKIKTITRDKEGHYIMFNGSIHQEDLTVINRYALNLRAPKYWVGQKVLSGFSVTFFFF